MSPTKRPSSVAAMRRAVAASPAAAAEPVPGPVLASPQLPRPAVVKPVRITLNLPPDLFRQLARWTEFAAEQLDRPRVSVQDTLRAMVAAGVADVSPSSPVLAELRHTPRHHR